MRARSLFVLLAALAACKSSHTFVDAGDDGDDTIDGGGDLPEVDFPATVLLGPGDCGADKTLTFDAENTGGGGLEYTITSSTSVIEVSPASGTIIGGTTTTFTVTAHVPSDAAPGTPVTGELSIDTNLDDEPVVIAVSVDPRGGVLRLEPASAGFGDVQIGGSDEQTIAVHNDGNAAVDVSFGTPSNAEFAVAFTGGSLGAGAQRDATVTYTPAGLGTDNASAPITVTGAVCGASPTSLALSGNGQTAGGVLVTGNGAFGTVTCGTATTTTRTITMENLGAMTASWTASFLADPDSGLYELSETSGTIPAGETRTFDLTREAIALPATPGDRDVTLRVVTTVDSVATDHDLPVTQLLSGPYLEVDPASSDFGYAPVGEALTRQITVSNSGTASATVTYTENGTGFSVPQSGATIAVSGNGTFDASYDPPSLGTVAGSVSVSAPDSCSNPTVTLAGGDGPWTQFASPASVSVACSDTDTPIGYIYVTNEGTQTLQISGCVETTSTDVDPVVTPDPQSVGSGFGSAQLDIGWSRPSPLVSGETTATVTCNTNEKFHTTRTFEVVRTMYGADLTLSPVTDFNFSCSGTPMFTEKFLRIQNDGNQDAYLGAETDLPSGLYGVNFGFFTVGSGSASTTDVGVGMGSGCVGTGMGSVGLYTGSASVCSMSPSSVEVVLDP